MNDEESKSIIKAIEDSGFPFERKVRRRLKELGFDTQSTQYMAKNKEGIEISNELDVFGRIKHPIVSTQDNKLHVSLNVRIVGEVKKYSDYVICFYDLDNENPDNFWDMLSKSFESGVQSPKISWRQTDAFGV